MLPHRLKDRFKALLPYAPLLLPALTFAVFTPALAGGFLHWDDIYGMAEGGSRLGLSPVQLAKMFGSCSMGPYTPLNALSRAVDFLVWGESEAGHHLTSVLLHAANALACYFACLALLKAARPEDAVGEPGLRPAAGAAALLFALHPLRVESVAWLSGRHDVLCALFWLGSITFYLRSRSAAGAPHWRAEAAPLACFALALLSKGTAVTLPAVLLVLDLYPLRRLPLSPRRWIDQEHRGVLLEKLPYAALALVFAAAGYACQTAAGSLHSFAEAGPGQRLGTALYGVLLYPWKTLLPLHLSPFYQLPRSFTLFSPAGLALAAAVLGATGALFSQRRRLPGAAAGWAYYLITLAPVAGLVKINMQSAADRYSYLPGLAFAALAGAGLRRSFASPDHRLRAAAAAAAALALAALAALSWRQQAVWRDTETLWRHALRVNPEISLVHNNLGHILAARGALAEAELHYNEALRLDPESAFAHYNLGGMLLGRGALAEAEDHNREAVRLKPDFALAWYNLGVVAAARGLPAEAEQQYREAARLNPGFAMAHYNLGILLAARGQAYEAALSYEAALRANPVFAEARGNLAGLLADRGLNAAAEEQYRAALAADPRLATAHNNLALLLAARGQRAEAEQHYRAAIAARPDFALAYINLARLLAAGGRQAEAQTVYNEAQRLAPRK